MGKRLPTILGKAIDDTVRTLNEESEEERIVDLVKCIERMEDLMDDLHANVRRAALLLTSRCRRRLMLRITAPGQAPPDHGRQRSRREPMEPRDRKVLSRQGLYERSLALCRSVESRFRRVKPTTDGAQTHRGLQVPASARVL